MADLDGTFGVENMSVPSQEMYRGSYYYNTDQEDLLYVDQHVSPVVC